MARKTTARSSEPIEVLDAVPDKFPPDGLYTMRHIAEYLGVHEDSIRKRYYNRYCKDIFANCLEMLKSGNFYTQTFFDECIRIRQSCDTDRLIFNEKGMVVRHAPKEGKMGLPVTEPNPERMTKAEYIQMRLGESPELQPEVREDALEVIEGEEVTAITTYSPEYADKFQGALDQTEDLGQQMSNWLEAIDQAADVTADKASAQFAGRFMERFNKNMGELQSNLGKALGG